MSIKFTGISGPPIIGDMKATSKTGTGKSADVSKSDHVEFSAVLRNVSQSTSSGNPEEAERTARVQELKEQVAQGSYEPDIHKVAGSLLQFLVENK